MVFLRSFADGLPLHDWLFQQVFPREARLFPEAIYALTRLAVLELLSGGVTAAFDMYFYRDAYVQAVIDSGFRSILCGYCRICSDECHIYRTCTDGAQGRDCFDTVLLYRRRPLRAVAKES